MLVERGRSRGFVFQQLAIGLFEHRARCLLRYRAKYDWQRKGCRLVAVLLGELASQVSRLLPACHDRSGNP